MTSSRRQGSKTEPGHTSDTGRYLVAQALADIVQDEHVVLREPGSRTVVHDAYHAAVDDDERSEFERIMTDAAEGKPMDDAGSGFVHSVIDAVYLELAEVGVQSTLVHEISATFSERAVALYNFSMTKHPGTLEEIPLSSGVRTRVLNGAERVSQGHYRDGIAQFEHALSTAETLNDVLTPRILAGWAHHWNGDDEQALDFAEEALAYHFDNWSARLLRTVTSHDSPGLFRDGQLSISAYLRVLATVPPESDLDVDVGFPKGSDLVWEPLSGDPELFRLSTLEPETRVRLTLSGPIDRMPGLRAYYLAVGIIDEVNDKPRSVEYKPISGPSSINAIEIICFDL